MSKLQSLYDKSPYWLQHLLLNVQAYRIHCQRYGAQFESVFEELLTSQWLSREEIEKYQIARLKNLLDHAYESVPFYRKRYDEHGVSPKDIKDLRDLSKLPLLTREDVRNAGSSLVSSRVAKSDLVHGHTSGTTGSPLDFYWDKNTCVYTNAVDWRQKFWGGVSYGDPIALFLGRTIVATSKATPPFWQLDRLHNMLWCSSFHLAEQYLPAIFNKLFAFNPVAIEGYPSTIYILARYLKAKNQFFPVKAIFTSSETLLPLQRSLIEERFVAPVFDFLGMAERVIFATQCDQQHSYHLNFEYAVNEVVDGNGDVVDNGQDGYLVGTSLVNYAMPFIRYLSNDISSINYDNCACGRMMPQLNAVTTKDEDIVVTPSGKLVSSSVLTHPFKPMDAVFESQIVQEQLDLLKIRIVRRVSYTDEDSQKLIQALKERVGNEMRIELEFVDAIARTKAGKLRWVISKVALPL